MCFVNCPYENYHGECTKGLNIPPDGYCQEDQLNEEDQLKENENANE